MKAHGLCGQLLSNEPGALGLEERLLDAPRVLHASAAAREAADSGMDQVSEQRGRGGDVEEDNLGRGEVHQRTCEWSWLTDGP